MIKDFTEKNTYSKKFYINKSILRLANYLKNKKNYLKDNLFYENYFDENYHKEPDYFDDLINHIERYET